MPTYNFIVEGEVERRAEEKEEEERSRQVEENNNEEDQIRERSYFYINLSKIFHLALIAGFGAAIARGTSGENNAFIVVSLVLSLSFFFYSMWISWSL